jgi:hypothetical protein
MRPDPYADDNLTDGEKAVFGEIYPLLDDIEKRVGGHVDHILWIAMTQRLASRGYLLEQLQKELDEQHRNQLKYNRPN